MLHVRVFAITLVFAMVAGAQTPDRAEAPITLAPLNPESAPVQGEFTYLGFEVHTPWLDGPLIMRMPETLASSMGLHFIDHYRADMPQLSRIAPAPRWLENPETGALQYEARTEEGVIFRGTATPVADGVEMRFVVRNETGERLEQVNNQMCLVMSEAPAFGETHDLSRTFAWIGGDFTALSGTTPTPAQKGRSPWILLRTEALGQDYRGPMENPDGWWVVDQFADHNLLARRSEDSEHLLAIAWNEDNSMLMTNTNIPCLHAGPNRSHDLAPGEEAVWEGKIYLMADDPDALLAAWRKDRQAWFQPGEDSARAIALKPIAIETPMRREEGLAEGTDLSRIAFEMRAPWMDGSVELRMPEYLRSSMGFHFLDHYLSTIAPISELDPFPRWERDGQSGALRYEHETDEGVVFGGEATPEVDAVALRFWVQNNTGDTIHGVDGNMCLDLGGSGAFNQRWTLDPLYAYWDGELQSLAKTTPTPEEVGREPWIIMLTEEGEESFEGPKDTGVTWWRVDQIAEANLMAAESADGAHLIAYTWDRAPQNLMSNCGNPCLHTGPGPVPTLAPGETHIWHGKIYFIENDKEALLHRVREDHVQW